MKNLSKTTKILIVLSVLWEIIIITSMSVMWYGDYIFASRIAHFVILSLPIWLYWAGVWIWGFGYLKKINNKLTPLKNNIRKRFSFYGELNRGDFIGLYIFFNIIPYLVNVLSKDDELTLISTFFCLYGIVNIIIKRANSFTNTPWFFGIVYILYFILIFLKDGLEANGINLDNADQSGDWAVTIFHAWALVGVLWIVMFLYLCLKKSKPMIAESKKD